MKKHYIQKVIKKFFRSAKKIRKKIKKYSLFPNTDIGKANRFIVKVSFILGLIFSFLITFKLSYEILDRLSYFKSLKLPNIHVEINILILKIATILFLTFLVTISIACLSLYILLNFHERIGNFFNRNYTEKRFLTTRILKQRYKKFDKRVYANAKPLLFIFFIVIVSSILTIPLLEIDAKKYIPQIFVIGLALSCCSTGFIILYIGSNYEIDKTTIKNYFKIQFFTIVIGVIELTILTYLMMIILWYMINHIMDFGFSIIARMLSDSLREWISQYLQLKGIEMEFFDSYEEEISYLSSSYDLSTIMKTMLPYLFIFIISAFIFMYLIPIFYLDREKNRKIISLTISFILGIISSKIIFWSLPKIFMFDRNSIMLGIILLIIAYLLGESIESKVEHKIEKDKICMHCDQTFFSNANFCNICGRELIWLKK